MLYYGHTCAKVEGLATCTQCPCSKSKPLHTQQCHIKRIKNGCHGWDVARETDCWHGDLLFPHLDSNGIIINYGCMQNWTHLMAIWCTPRYIEELELNKLMYAASIKPNNVVNLFVPIYTVG